MNIEQKLHNRSGSKCELCNATGDLSVHIVTPKTGQDISENALLCDTCLDQVLNPEKLQTQHWHCLNESMWSEVPAVQVLAWRTLTQLINEGWAQNLLEMLYLDEETLTWAKDGLTENGESTALKHVDSNGALLSAGDTVTLIKDLNVKGANFTAKRGTAVRNITLTYDNAEHIEGKVNGQHIVILTKFVKKN
ncbi:PhnA domain-containing protein [Reichenbachiella agarivorans]|uniref:PhnA domain-containing protein n=1 Tax=Reichenbachiella agarivorans TaxID=2979464 RepID=A0ABY6CLL0_9BACT|nr:alkylphosphonate utilization protein [Reichenbachiella agarivorans]UXP30970.1 PhnA domain-containing protein [Reichenbachiella agarivorans]